MEAEDQGYLRRPNPMKARSTKRDKKKYYRYHKDHDHDTEECWQLKDKIKILIY